MSGLPYDCGQLILRCISFVFLRLDGQIREDLPLEYNIQHNSLRTYAKLTPYPTLFAEYTRRPIRQADALSSVHWEAQLVLNADGVVLSSAGSTDLVGSGLQFSSRPIVICSQARKKTFRTFQSIPFTAFQFRYHSPERFSTNGYTGTKRIAI